MTDYEKLGAFYLGKQYDLATRTRSDDLLMYDARDLTTHAVIIGMTGSGKTGLGIGLLEEALIDRIPVIAIDPKGDLGNLALRFPSLSAGDFRPWVDAQQAATAGMSEDDFAARQATNWKNGLAEWGQDGARISRLDDAAPVTIYTPGSSAGVPVSLLRAFTAPPASIRDDAEAFSERVNATATSVLSLLGVDADPISSREHILLSNLFGDAWQNGRDLDLASLIAGIQSPPFATLGVMPLDTIFPAKDRLTLAMRLNNLLAAPGFQAWMQGEALDTARLLYDDRGQPRASIVSIAHLSDAERMFFVTLLLADVIAWMRTQPGTGSLRAILYIDELFGFMPPVAAPSSKALLLTLLKQARAFGLGVVLATQNPVDLDYRGLSNAGTWFIGRLQTERDKMRVLEGLEGASAGREFDRASMERVIAGLGKRVFLMHSVHEPAPITFETRWTLSYLAGPMTREQIRALRTSSSAESLAANTPAASASPSTAFARAAHAAPPLAAAAQTAGAGSSAPVLPADIPQYFLGTNAISGATYVPRVVGVVDVAVASARHGIAEQRRMVLVAPVDDAPIPLDWNNATHRDDLDVSHLDTVAPVGARFMALPAAAGNVRNYAAWRKQLQQWIVANERVELFTSKPLALTSRVGESEREFRIRLQMASREVRDANVDKLRNRYTSKVSTLQDRIRRAEQAVQRESAQARQAGLDTMVALGTAMLGAVFGRGKVTAGSIGKMGTAARGAGRTMQQRGDVSRASESVEALQAQLATLEQEIEQEVQRVAAEYDADTTALDTITITPKSSDVRVQVLGLLWMPMPEAFR